MEKTNYTPIILSDFISTNNEEFIEFCRDFVSNLNSNNEIISDLVKYTNTLDRLYLGIKEPKTPKQVFFIKCSSEVNKRIKYDSINKIFLNIESYKLHSVGEAFLKIKAIHLKKRYLLSSNFNANTSKTREFQKKSDIKILEDSKSLCSSCGKKYPIERKELGYNICINCSTEQAKTYVDKGFQTREGHKIMSSKAYRNSRNKK